MMNRKRSWTVTKGLAVVGCLLLSVALVACSGEVEEEQTVRRPPPPPREDPTPTVTPVAELKDRLRIDERVRFPENQAPETDEERKAILQFFDAQARGDHEVVASFLTDIDRRELERMIKAGHWQESTKNITDIEIYQTGTASGISYDADAMGLSAMGSMREFTGLDRRLMDELGEKSLDEIEQMIKSGEFREQYGDQMPQQIIDGVEQMVERGMFREQMQEMARAMDDVMASIGAGGKCVLALFDVDGEFQAQLWYYDVQPDRVVFEAAPTPPNVVNHLHGEDWIRVWHQLIAEEIMLAQQSDIEFDPGQIVLDEVQQPSQSPSGGGPRPGGPQPAPPPERPREGPPTRTPPGAPSPY